MRAHFARALARALAGRALEGTTTTAAAGAAGASAAPAFQHLAAATTTTTRGFVAEAAAAAPATPRDDAKPRASPTSGRRRTPSSSSSSSSSFSGGRRRANDGPGPEGDVAQSLWEENMQVLRRTWPVRVAPALDGRVGGGGGESDGAARLRTVRSAVNRALANGPDGVMLATRADVLAFLGVEGGEAGLDAAVMAARRRSAGAAEDADNADDKNARNAAAAAADAETDADADAPRSDPYTPHALVGRLLAAPELDRDFRPVAWWVALPSAAARRRAVAECDGRELGAGGPCRVTPGTASDMVAATRGRSPWHLTGRLASRSGGEAVLLRGISLPPAGGPGSDGGRTAAVATMATAVRAALLAAGLELRNSKLPVRIVVRNKRGGWQELHFADQLEEEEGDEDEGAGVEAAAAKGEQRKSSNRRKKDASSSSSSRDSSKPPREIAAVVWLASPDEARRAERELHGKPLAFPGANGVNAAAAAAVVSASVLP